MLPAQLTAPVFEHHTRFLGIDEPCPRLSWRVLTEEALELSSYEVMISRDGNTEIHGPIPWRDPVLLPWPGRPLAPREAATVAVRVRDENGRYSDWSAGRYVERGLSPADWQALPVGAGWHEQPGTDRHPPIIRHRFVLEKAVAKARLYLSAHGLCETLLNGQRTDHYALFPGWTSYHHRLRYLTLDVTSLLVSGENVISALMGDGWYRGRIGCRGGVRDAWGKDLSLIAQLEITFTDGSTSRIVSDGSWRSDRGPVLFSGIYEGEIYDARLEQQGWTLAGFDDSHWFPVSIGHRNYQTLQAPDGPLVVCTQQIKPVQSWISDGGKQIFDFGQNLVGRVCLKACGRRGDNIKLRHAEVIQDRALYTRTLRTAIAADSYIFADEAMIEWEPRFTFHGFRYLEIEASQQVYDSLDVIACVYHTDLPRTGWFSCSDDRLNRLNENIIWSMRGNFLDIPTDCPQRDERLGWTGDIQVFMPTAEFLYDCSGMMRGWLKDLVCDQHPCGMVPWYIPDIPDYEPWTWNSKQAAAAWGDAAVLTPWDLYWSTADEQMLAAQYQSACAWVELQRTRAGASLIWDKGFQFGDWLDPSAPPEDPSAAMTDKGLVATAYFAWSAYHLSRISAVLNRPEDTQRWQRLFSDIRQAFVQRYVSDTGRVARESQTAYALIICFGLFVCDSQRDVAGQRLSELVRQADYHIATGFVGTPLILNALCLTGHADTAFRQLTEESCPSWLYPVKQGATTIWERWDSLLADGKVNSGQMTSFNHYALGAVGNWLYQYLAGLMPTAAGYKQVRFQPHFFSAIDWAKARYLSVHGEISVNWKRVGEGIEIHLQLPFGTSGELVIEDSTLPLSGPGDYHFLWQPADGVTGIASVRAIREEK
ncbi:family 78 glycoside hydrolase catalytic domain [Erwinia papayae]|uniref:alpha-L-rhamnosidase n=1 Tax=Erwinia papayae TaxID=206499 RepID=A0ABV3N4U0_9GAMM